MEYATIKLLKSDLQILVDSGVPFHYEVTKVEIKDMMFENDKTHRNLKDKANKAYKELKEYEFNKRNK